MDVPAALLALQECDLEIARIEKVLDELPEKRSILDTRHKADDVRQLREKAEELVRRLDRSIASNDDEVSTVRDKIASVQNVLDTGSVTNPKEVHNLSREMDALRRRVDKVENETIGLMEKLEKARGQMEKVDAALEQLAQREQAFIAEYQLKGGELQRKRESERHRRSAIEATFDAALLSRYESLREAKSGIGAALLEESRCSVCRVQLPAGRVSELLAGPDIGICPNCRRLLVVRLADDSE